MLPSNAVIVMLAECFSTVGCRKVVRCDAQQISQEGVLESDGSGVT